MRQEDGDVVLPVGITCTLLVGPGVSVSHAAVSLCAASRTLLLWTGEEGVRVYAAGFPRDRSDAIVRQALLASNEDSRLIVTRRLYRLMFGDEAPRYRSVDQLRGIEGSRVKKIYAELATEFDISWSGRPSSLEDPVGAALAGVNAALYGICEAAILALGYSPSIGFIHRGDPRSFVFDLADTVKFSRNVARLAFALAKESDKNIEHRSRTAARDHFLSENLLNVLTLHIDEVMNAIDDS